MRIISQEMKDYLKQTATNNAFFMDIVCKNGDVVRINSTDRDIETDIRLIPKETDQPPFIYKAGGYIPSEYSYSSDGSVQKLDITGLAQEGYFDKKLIMNNFYEGAEIFISLCNYKDLSIGQVKISRGFIGNFEIDSNGKFTCEYRGFSQKMNNSTAKLYSYDCRAKLFDGQCKVKESNYIEISSITKKVDSLTFQINSLHNEPEYYIGGKIIFTSGRAKQLSSQIRVARRISEQVIEVEIMKPMSITPEKNDSLNIRPGCDKKLSTCKNKFNNVENFRGEPYVPGDNVFNIMGNGQESKKETNTLLS